MREITTNWISISTEEFEEILDIYKKELTSILISDTMYYSIDSFNSLLFRVDQEGFFINGGLKEIKL